MTSLSNFDFHNKASGQFFLSRQDDARMIADHIQHKRNVMMYSGYKTGKQSLVNQAFEYLKKIKYEIVPITVDMFNISSADKFLKVYFRESVAVSKKLDQNALFPLYIGSESLVSMNDILDLPDRMGNAYGKELVVYLKNFHNVLNFNKAEEFLKCFEQIVAKRSKVTYLITGSCVNVMQYIFEHKKYFFNQFEHLPISPIGRKDVADFLESTFIRTGRVIEREISDRMYEICGGHPWYIMQFASFCHNLTLGYVNAVIIEEAKKMMISLHYPRFMQMIGELTENQVNFLQAVNDGVERYTSAEVMEKYRLNSSANVVRIKEALKKKEILMFDANDAASVIDPLFEYWLKNYYFV